MDYDPDATMVEIPVSSLKRQRTEDYELCEPPLKKPCTKYLEKEMEKLCYHLKSDKITFFDLETTGLNIEQDKIIEISIVCFDSVEKVIHNITQRINPGVDSIMHPVAAKTHGISLHELISQPTLVDFWPNIKVLFDDSTIIGHNVENFDIPLLQNELMRYSLSKPRHSAVWDTYTHTSMMMEKHIIPRGRKSLGEIFKTMYPGKTPPKAHSAYGDVQTTILIASQILHEYLKSFKLCQKTYQ